MLVFWWWAVERGFGGLGGWRDRLRYVSSALSAILLPLLASKACPFHTCLFLLYSALQLFPEKPSSYTSPMSLSINYLATASLIPSYLLSYISRVISYKRHGCSGWRRISRLGNMAGSLTIISAAISSMQAASGISSIKISAAGGRQRRAAHVKYASRRRRSASSAHQQQHHAYSDNKMATQGRTWL